MHVCYVILSPAFGIHQGTADLVNLQFVPHEETGPDSSTRVTVLTIYGAPVDRYTPQASVQSVVSMRGTGLQRTSFNLRALWKVYRTILKVRPDVVHFNGPHIWNPILLLRLRRARIPTVQTVHDLDPHSGVGYGRLLYIWNDLVIRAATHVLVYSQINRNRLIKRGISPKRVTYVPLLHLFLSYENERRLTTPDRIAADNDHPFALFFARIEAYKGVSVLVEAMRRIEASAHQTASGVSAPSGPRVVIAGKGDIRQFVAGTLPDNVEIRNRLIEDDEAIDLFRRCSVVVLPYIDATQSALIAAAYFFGKPVIVTRTGALPEYVVEGETGWVIEPENSQALGECLQAVLSDPVRLAKMAGNCRTWYQAQRHFQREALLVMYQQLGAASRNSSISEAG